jgi:hypothetical protein
VANAHSVALPGSPPPPPDTLLYRLWPATCSLISMTLPPPLLTIDFPCDPFSLPSCSYTVAGCFRLVLSLQLSAHSDSSLMDFLYPEDGGDTFLRNVGSHKKYTASHPRKWHILHVFHFICGLSQFPHSNVVINTLN